MLDALMTSKTKQIAPRKDPAPSALHRLLGRVSEARHARDVARMKAHLAWTDQQRKTVGRQSSRTSR